MAAPTPQAVGTIQRGVGAITVPWPAHEINDVALLFVETANQAATLSTPAGFVEVTNQGVGVAAAAAATRLTIFWCRATSGAMASPVVADSGARQSAVIHTFRGCIESGNPWDVFAGNTNAGATAVSIPGATTTVVDTLAVLAMSNALGIGATAVQPTTLANGSLTNLTKRYASQPDGTGGGGGVVPSKVLKVGLSAFGRGGDFGDVGEGPGMDTVGPILNAVLFVPNRADMSALIDVADEKDILLVMNIAGNKGAYSDTVGGVVTLNMTKYQQNVEQYAPNNTAFSARAKFADAVARKRIVFYTVDEPNLRNSTNPDVPNISPSQTNQMGLIHKSLWPGCVTIVRCAANTLASGWGGSGRPAGGYTGLDYCWLQYNNNHAKGGTNTWGTPIDPRDEWTEQRAVINSTNLQMGIIVSLNLWAGGIGNDFLGVPAKWDVGADGGPTGYLIGDRDAGEGTETLTLPDSMKSLAASPDWIKKFADLVFADNDIPFYLMWQHATTTNPARNYYTYYNRADYQAAFDYCITKGLSRTSFNGWRTPK